MPNFENFSVRMLASAPDATANVPHNHTPRASWVEGSRSSFGAYQAAAGSWRQRAAKDPAPLLLMPPFLMKYGARGPFGRTSGLHGLFMMVGDRNLSVSSAAVRAGRVQAPQGAAPLRRGAPADPKQPLMFAHSAVQTHK